MGDEWFWLVFGSLIMLFVGYKLGEAKQEREDRIRKMEYHRDYGSKFDDAVLEAASILNDHIDERAVANRTAPRAREWLSKYAQQIRVLQSR